MSTRALRCANQSAFAVRLPNHALRDAVPNRDLKAFRNSVLAPNPHSARERYTAGSISHRIRAGKLFEVQSAHLWDECCIAIEPANAKRNGPALPRSALVLRDSRVANRGRPPAPMRRASALAASSEPTGVSAGTAQRLLPRSICTSNARTWAQYIAA